MSRGDRTIILAVLGLALVGAAQPQEAAGIKNKKPAAEQVTTQRPPPSLPPIIRTVSADKPDVGCDRDKDDRRSDLCAQWKAADAARDAARWGLGQMIVGSIGLVIGGFTLLAAFWAARWAKQAAVETKRGADIATDSLDRAREANVLTEQAIRADNRAWLKLYIKPVSYHKNLNGQLDVSFEVRAKNIGKSAALDCDVFFKFVPNNQENGHITILEMMSIMDTEAVKTGAQFFSSDVFPDDTMFRDCGGTASLPDGYRNLEVFEAYFFSIVIGVSYRTVFDKGIEPRAQTSVVYDIGIVQKGGIPTDFFRQTDFEEVKELSFRDHIPSVNRIT